MTSRVAKRGRCVLMLLFLSLGACAPGANYLAADIAVRGGFDQGDASPVRLAITHRFTLRVPSAETEAIQRNHMAECRKLGCTIMSSSIDRSNEGRITARAAVRIRPESYDAFAVLLATPPAKVIVRSQSAEDIGLAIIDIEKRLEAKTLVRDRLTAMLRDQTAKTAADLVTIEKELAQLQGDIETISAQGDALRSRTDTVRVEILYMGAAGQFGGIDLTPIHQAISGIGQTVVSSVAWLISTIVAVVPWLPIIGFVWWGTSRMIRRWRTRKAQL